MAKKFVEVNGLNKIFNVSPDGSSLDTSTLKKEVQATANSNSILFINATEEDNIYGYPLDSRWIWTRNKLYDCNNTKTDLLIPVTYDQLKQLRDTNILVPGQQYRITDYVTTVANYDEAWSAGHPFDVIVTADSNNKLNENARAIQREGDEYFKDCKLESWELKYCLDNDSTRFDWAADEASGLVPVEKIGVVTLPVSAYWYSVAYGDGKFVAIVANSSNISAYSTDGINWTQTTLPVSANWQSVAYGDGKFVAIAANSSNISAYSTDGINWTQTTLPVSANWQSVAYGDGKFVAVINSISNIAAYSTDGINWTQTTLPVSAYWQSVAYGDGKFVAVASFSNIAAYSTDGINWTQTTLPVSAYWQSVAYGDGKFVAVASFSNIAAYSTDGINWTQTTLPTQDNWWPITYGDGKFVTAAYSSNIAAYSEDGINWTQTTLPASVVWSSVAYGNGKFVAVANRSNIAAYSTDGITWTREYIYTEYETVTVPSKGTIYYLKDEFENECSYDFKNVLYKRYRITDCPKHSDWVGTYHGMDWVDYETIDKNDFKWYYTFSLNETEETDDIRDGSLYTNTDNIYRQNRIGENIAPDDYNTRSLNNIVYRQLNGNLDDCFENIIEPNCYNATIGMNWTYNFHVGNDCSNWSCGNNCRNWSCGNYCYVWTCGDYCSNWTCGSYCYNWSCGNNCCNWSCGNECYNWSCQTACSDWSCENNCSDWSCGSNCGGWSCKNNCYNWSCGNQCSRWSCGNGCYSWSCQDGCENWSCGNNVNNWSVGGNCYGWSCGDNVQDWMFGDGATNKSYYANITIDSGCRHFYLTSSNTTSTSSLLQNIHVMSGVEGTSSNPLLIDVPDVGADYTIEINKNKKTISL